MNYNQSALFKKNTARDTFSTFLDKAVRNGALDRDYNSGLLDVSQNIDRKQMANLIHRAKKPNQEIIKKRLEKDIISTSMKTSNYDLIFYYNTNTKVLGYKGKLTLDDSCTTATADFKLESIGNLTVIPKAELTINKTVSGENCALVIKYQDVDGKIYNFPGQINDENELKSYIRIIMNTN